MTLEILTRYLHFISIFTIAATVVAEYLLTKPNMTRSEIARLARIDGIYGLSAILAVAAGFTLWFAVGKPAEFYTNNWILHTKVGLAILLGIFSLPPTVFFMKQRKGPEDEQVETPKMVTLMLRLELALLFIIPLLASLMAKGIGYFGA